MHASDRDIAEAFATLPDAERANAKEAAGLLCEALGLSWFRACLMVSQCRVGDAAYAWLAGEGVKPDVIEQLKTLLAPAALADGEDTELESDHASTT